MKFALQSCIYSTLSIQWLLHQKFATNDKHVFQILIVEEGTYKKLLDLVKMIYGY